MVAHSIFASSLLPQTPSLDHLPSAFSIAISTALWLLPILIFLVDTPAGRNMLHCFYSSTKDAMTLRRIEHFPFQRRPLQHLPPTSLSERCGQRGVVGSIFGVVLS